MIKVAKTYTVKYAYAGYTQYERYSEDKDGNIISKRFRPSYSKKGEVPLLDKCNSIEEILTTITEFTKYPATIHLINGQIPEYFENTDLKQAVRDAGDKIARIKKEAIGELVEKQILPILAKNKWKISTSWIGKPVLIVKNEEGKWDNVPDCPEAHMLDLIGAMFTTKDIEQNMEPEVGTMHTDGFYGLTNYAFEVFDKHGYIVNSKDL